LVDRFGLTTVFVTHDQSEAVAMGHRLAVMYEGAIVQAGTYEELYQQPVNQFVAGFLGSPPMNFFPAQRQGEVMRLDLEEVDLRIPVPDRLQTRLAPDARFDLGLRPEHFSLTAPHTLSAIPCQVDMAELSISDATTVLHLQHGSHTFYAKLDRQLPIRPGQTTWLQFEPQHLYYFDSDGRRL
jgi:multiple sugar transport system ATP-binding protein